MRLPFFITLFLLCFPIFNGMARVYYVAPTGNDVNPGTFSAPFLTIQRAQEFVSSGDTVYIRGGEYIMSEAQIAKYYSIWAYVTYLDKSGTPGNHIRYWAFPGEKPVFNYSNIKPLNYRINAFEVAGSYIHIKGIEVVGVQVTILTHTQSICFSNSGNYNIFEQLSMHDGQAIGFYSTKGSNNLVLNCDAYRNWDYTSETGRGGNVDGFGFHSAKGGTGNVLKGCRAWFNSDDGYDCINSAEAVLFDSCWAFYNGYSTTFSNLGDGNGFKIGGYGQAPVVSKLPNPIPSNTVRFCLAYRNKANGFYANHHVEAGNYWYNNTAYRNSTNYNMLSQRITVSPTTGNDTTIDCHGFNHVLYNNISFKYSTQRDTLNIGFGSINTHNSFTLNSGLVVDANDFISIDEALLTAPRQANGNLPEIGFLKLKAGSDLIDKGKDLGFPFNNVAPDLGAFELKASQNIQFDELGSKTLNDSAFKLYASASSGLPVEFTSSNILVAKVLGDMVLITGTGTAEITAYQPGNIQYYAAGEVKRLLTITENPSAIKNNYNIKVFTISGSDKLIINVEGITKQWSVKILNINGVELISKDFYTMSSGIVDLSNIPKSVYLVRISFKNGEITRKIIKG